ncbi:MAG: AAA family ATPase [Pseudomonadota bacterium]|nr:AAA family ATPase [Pseudomonadota bacterium]
MYEKYFGLTERPFSIAPDPRFLYMSQQHREALAHLLYGVGDGGGFVQLTGEVGTGKTTICRCLLEQLPDNVDVALILNPRVTALELLASLCDELHIQYVKDTTSIKLLIDALNTYLLDTHAKGQRAILMIDEAQNLSAEALEQVRLLTNLETTREKLLQIILIGQPELRELLAREDLRQLSQRINARFHLEPISRAETAAYIRHRLQVCGAREPLFNENAVDLVHKLSAGVPRLINVVCDRAMLGAFVEGKRKVDAAIVHRAAMEVLPEEGLDSPKQTIWPWLAASAAVVLVAALVFLLFPFDWRPQTSQLVMEPIDKPLKSEPQAAPVTDLSTAGPLNQSPVLPPAELATTPVTDSPPLALTVALAQAGPEAAARAWSALYNVWGLQSSAVNDAQACAQAPAAGLRCLQGGGSWTALESYDRPAVLLLVAAGGRRVSVLLQEVLGSRVKIKLDDVEMEVSIADLKRHWFGEYRLLWKTPPNGSTSLSYGHRSADVKWLREQLQRATGLTSIAPDPLVFDAGLKQLVQTFQRDQELNADGVAGARTFINLNNLGTQPSVPRLGARAVSG